MVAMYDTTLQSNTSVEVEYGFCKATVQALFVPTTYSDFHEDTPARYYVDSSGICHCGETSVAWIWEPDSPLFSLFDVVACVDDYVRQMHDCPVCDHIVVSEHHKKLLAWRGTGKRPRQYR